MGRKNKLTKFSNDDLLELINNSKSFSDIVRYVGYNSVTTGSFQTVKNELKRRGIPIPVYNYFGKYANFGRKRKIEELLVENSSVSRGYLKKQLIKDNLLEYKCNCGNDGMWNGKKLILQLEHKNGINNDNRLVNLCFICPNCHSQTGTFSGKNKPSAQKKEKRKEKRIKDCECGKPIYHSSKMCFDCYSKSQRKVERPPYKKLIEEISTTSQNAVAKKYGVSWASISKWLLYYKKNEILVGLEPNDQLF